nr:MAG TPA: hypothetical protein [Caudoviricetes sp.]
MAFNITGKTRFMVEWFALSCNIFSDLYISLI